MKKQTVTALIVTRSLALGEGLNALFRAIPQIDEVQIVGTLEQALPEIEMRKPGIVLVDAKSSGNNTLTMLQHIARLSPQSRRVVLVDDVQDFKGTPELAEVVLVKGASPSAVAAIVTDLLMNKGEE